ncbi:MAG: heat-inducible transcriptional repressor HrcA [Oscillospiraceae bacterium]|nr:heat-inducible transcriptional repressor HrcA [Oscillospiraceae bacterium]
MARWRLPIKLDERKKRILAAIVEEYVATAKPVGSSYIANLFGNNMSSATIRNEMAFLYEIGLLEQPHISAGRIPSLNGYRFYTENILERNGIDELHKAKIACLLESNPNQKSILTMVSAILAEITHCVAVLSTPHSKTDKIQHLEVSCTSNDLCIIILATTAHTIRHKVCKFNHNISSNFLTALNTFLNNTFANRYLTDITNSFVKSIISTNLNEDTSFQTILSPILLCIYQICLDSCNVDLYIKGRTNLLLYDEAKEDVAKALNLLEDPQKVLELMTTKSGELDIKVGQNLGGSELKPFSILDACYTAKSLGEGHITIIGPIKMRYKISASYVRYFAEILPGYLKG